jgi:hypothetical protein
LKIRHIVLALSALLAIAFMQPLVTFLGGLTVLLGVGAWIYRDLSPASQDAVERRLLGWLRRARPESSTAARSGPLSLERSIAPELSEPDALFEPPRRARGKLPVRRAATASEPPASSSLQDSEGLK